jgi:hypothetical protein
VVDHDTIQQALAVEPGRANHPRFARLLLPTDGPRANPIARAVGDGHDLCTRTHRRQRWRDLVTEVEAQLKMKGPWTYQRSARYDEPAVTAAVENIAAEEHAKVAA